MTVNAITPFLATVLEVQQALHSNADFKGFLALALKSSGDALCEQDLNTVRFRVVDHRTGIRDDLNLDDELACWGQRVSIRDLVAGELRADQGLAEGAARGGENCA